MVSLKVPAVPVASVTEGEVSAWPAPRPENAPKPASVKALGPDVPKLPLKRSAGPVTLLRTPSPTVTGAAPSAIEPRLSV